MFNAILTKYAIKFSRQKTMLHVERSLVSCRAKRDTPCVLSSVARHPFVMLNLRFLAPL